MQLYSRLNVLLLSAASAWLLTGCAQSVDDLYTYIDESKARYVGSVQPIPQFKPYESFTYSASDLRDPFEPAVNLAEEEDKDDLLSPDKTRPRQPLEAFSLDSLRMVGTLERSKNNWTLIMDPDGGVHRVQVGNFLGRAHGKIVETTDTYVAVVEIVSDGTQDGWVERPRTIKLSGM